MTDIGFEDDGDEDNILISWKIKKRMVPNSSKGKMKVVSEIELIRQQYHIEG